MTARRLIMVALVPLMDAAVYAQEPQHEFSAMSPFQDSTRRYNAGSILFDKNLNTYNWIGRLGLDTSVAGTRIGFQTLYLSNIIQTESNSPNKQLESSQNSLTLDLHRPITNDFGPRVRWSSFLYSDNKGAGLSNASNNSLLGGFVYRPWSVLSVAPMVGYSWDSQGSIRDRGFSVDVSGFLNGLEVDGYRMQGNAQFHRDNLAPRTLENHFAAVGVQKPFTALTRDSLQVGVSHLRREFYVLNDSTIEQRTERIFSVANLLEYELDRSILASLFVNVGGRSVDKGTRQTYGPVGGTPTFDTEIEEFRIDTYFQALYRSESGRMSGALRLGYIERSEAHRAVLPADASAAIQILHSVRNRQEQTKDNLTRRVLLTGSLSLPLFQSDRISFAGSAGMLRYDTPSEQNVEDRDELLVVLTLATRHEVSRFLEVGVTLDGTLSHLVYLLKERSANNNINRVLRLSPRTIIRPTPWFSSFNAFEVLANYTVYDFEQEADLVRSFSYRQFGWLDSTRIDFTNRIGFDLYTYLKIYERGLLRWSDFTERTENSFVDQTLAAQVRFSPHPSVVFAVGLRYFSQSRYVFDQTGKRLDTFQSSVGPTCAIQWEIGPHSVFWFRGWYEHRKQAGGMTTSLASMTMNILLHL